MPRTSRKTTADTSVHPQGKSMEEDKIYKTAVYARLSIEDSGRNNKPTPFVLGTIENQILLVQKYIESKPYLQLCETFADNGQTGTNFDREGFQSLMEAVKRGRIECIVVKDLSRFGRDYIETGDYLEKILPFLGVRFISVNDGYDSHDRAKSGDTLTVALKNLINDMYAKDISRKVRTAFEIKQHKGEYFGWQAPYGYLKSPENKHKLRINEETAPVVRDIFKWKADKMSNSAIVRKLNENEVLSPGNYLYSKGLVRHEKFSRKTLWSKDCVKKILNNPAYIGHVAQGKTKSDLCSGLGKKNQPKDKWIVVENMHEPIIDPSVFANVSTIMEKVKQEYYAKQAAQKWETQENIFKGIVFCSGCGKNLSRKKFMNQNKKIYSRFLCSNYIVHLSERCKNKNISEENLKEIIFAAIHQQTDLLNEIKNKAEKVNSSSKTKQNERELYEEKQLINQRILKLNSLRSSLYDDFQDGLLTEKDYNYTRRKYESESNNSVSRLDEIASELKKYSADNEFHGSAEKSNEETLKLNAAEMRHYKISGYDDVNEFSREMLTALVEKIIVHDKNIIEIMFKYKDEFTIIKNIKEDDILYE